MRLALVYSLNPFPVSFMTRWGPIGHFATATMNGPSLDFELVVARASHRASVLLFLHLIFPVPRSCSNPTSPNLYPSNIAGVLASSE